jgi:RNA polymerase sigma factor (TIGR02999 family)
METPPGDVTVLLRALTEGNQQAASQLVPLVYDELRSLAARYMRRERPDHTLQATALVHEAYLKLVKQRSANWQSRVHFFAIAATIMRRILIDYARRHPERSKRADKRISLDQTVMISPDKSEQLLKLDGALDRLTKLDPRQGKIVELRFFGGLTVEETAHLLDISPKTVKREWSVAKAWLHGALHENHGDYARELGGG